MKYNLKVYLNILFSEEKRENFILTPTSYGVCVSLQQQLLCAYWEEQCQGDKVLNFKEDFNLRKSSN